MLISDSHRFLFVHVQKTGGVTIDKMLKGHVHDLRSHGGRHATLGQILRKEPVLRDYWTFGFVRNPWTRFVSWWSMIDKWDGKWGPSSGRQYTGKGMRAGNDFWRAVAGYSDFEEFILRGTQEWSRMRTPQITYLTSGARRADFIGRTESFQDDIRAVLARFDLPLVEPGHHNRSEHDGHRQFYSDTTRERVAELFRKDIEAFGYKF